jgi:glycosyltransferase involved in cell wall biosynthesis
MKFLMTMYSIQDYGGIINHAEYLTKGLRNRGHEVDFCMLVPKQHHSNRRSYRADFSVYNELEGGTGYHFNQARGWLNVPKIPYLNELHRKRFKEKCSQYDAVLWHIPVPTLSNQNKGIKDWVDLYDHGSKNIAIIHDGNMPNLYPHLIKVSQHFHGAVCVHESAYHSAKNLDIPRKLIVNPFEIHGELGVEFEGRVGALAVQIFKAWKRVDTLVRAVPFINESVYVGGAGIEYRYMTSKEKCKPKYFDSNGNRIWDVALDHGMTYRGVLANSKVLEMLGRVKLQIDPSFSKKYSAFGAHFNRTSVEAMIKGAVPMATDLGMKNSEIFKADENYIEIPHTATPREFGDIVNEALSNKRQWSRIRENNLIKLTQHFDMDKVASQYEDFVNKPPTKRYPGYEIGQPDISLLASCNKNLEFFELDKMHCPNMGSPSEPEASEPPKTGLRTLTGKHYW